MRGARLLEVDLRRVFRVCLIASLVVHALGVLLLDRAWVPRLPTQRLRVVLLLPRQRFGAPAAAPWHPGVPGPSPDYGGPGAAPEWQPGTGPAPAPPSGPVEAGLPLSSYVPGPAKAGSPRFAGEAMPSPTGRPGSGAAGRLEPGGAAAGQREAQRFDLIDLATLSRTRDHGGAVIADPRRPQDLRGFVHFTNLWLNGLGSFYSCGNDCCQLPLLGALATFMSHATGVAAAVRAGTARDFVDGPLLQDPIHFLFPMCDHAGQNTHSVDLTDEEVEALGTYLKSGGFVFIDAEPNDPALPSALACVRRALHGEGRLYQLPYTHPVYSSLFPFGAGFPGDLGNGRVQDVGGAWYCPWPSSCDRPLGLWGIEWNGDLVGVVSDLSLRLGWSESLAQAAAAQDTGATGGQVGGAAAGAADGSAADAAAAEDATCAKPLSPGMPRLPYLLAGANVVAYALARPGSLAEHRAPPAWTQSLPQPPAQAGARPDAVDEDLLGDLGADLALLPLPVGTRLGPSGLSLLIDGLVAVEVADSAAQGVRLRRLPAGRHLVSLRYHGQRREVRLELRGGLVLTAGFEATGSGWRGSLHVGPIGDAAARDAWQERYGGLYLQDALWPEPDGAADGGAP